MLLFDSSDNYEEEEVDRISQLPDAVINNILSLSSIFTKDAVQTCLFSKRWINIWKSLPYLNFDVGDKTVDDVNDLIERVLLLRDDCEIQSFKLRAVWNPLDKCTRLSSSLSRYIDAIIKHNIQEVTLELDRPHSSFNYKIPYRLLNCKSLEKFTLVSKGTFLNISFPESTSLPHLKTLCFCGFTLSNLESFSRLLLSCPLLGILGIGNCDMRTATLIIKLLVKDAKVEQLDLYPGFIEGLYDAAGSLTYHPLPCLPNLQCLRLEIWFNIRSLRSIGYLLMISPNIKTLIVELKTSKQCDTGFDWKDVGTFSSGTLSPHLKFVRIEEIEGCDAELKFLGFLLKNAKVLEEVTLFYRFNASLPERARELRQFRDKVRALPKASSNIKIRLK